MPIVVIGVFCFVFGCVSGFFVVCLVVVVVVFVAVVVVVVVCGQRKDVAGPARPRPHKPLNRAKAPFRLTVNERSMPNVWHEGHISSGQGFRAPRLEDGPVSALKRTASTTLDLRSTRLPARDDHPAELWLAFHYNWNIHAHDVPKAYCKACMNR